MTRRQTPPLNALRAFDSAARHENFSAAAGELFVTHGAISRQVRALETWLGVDLFQRHGRRITLTPAGREYRAEIEAALDRIDLATARVRGAGGRELVVSSPPTLTMHWLVPRVSVFQVLYPGVYVRFVNANNPVAKNPERHDLAIVREPNAYAAAGARRFLAERCTPVCSPALLKRNPIRRATDLRHHVWLSSELRVNAWKEWLAVARQPGLKPQKNLHFPQLYVALQAAIDGLGVAIGPLPLIEREIQSGRLVMPLPRVASRAYSYFAVTPPETRGDAPVARLADWLVREGLRRRKAA